MIAIYATAHTGTVHLVRSENVVTYPQPSTLCGKVLRSSDGWHFGDETMSGLVATCKRCRKIMGADIIAAVVAAAR